MAGQGLRVEALGVAGAPAPRRLTTTYRLTGGIVLDTGAATHGLGPTERADLAAVLLSHAHLDHTLGLPFLLAETTLRVIGLQATLDAVRESLLDGRVWPDLSERAQWNEIAEGDVFDLGPWSVLAGPADHSIPCLSYCFRSADTCLVVVGDTRLSERVVAWVAAQRPDVCVVEVSFPNAMADLARQYGHQAPRDLPAWRAGLGSHCRLCVTHVKPPYEREINAECVALGDPNLHLLSDGDVVWPVP